MAKEIPILFSTPMVNAVLEGRKTMTRRTVKGFALDWLKPELGIPMFTPEFVALPENNLCRYGYPGDVLYVRETWVNVGHNNCQDGAEDFNTIVYKASENGRAFEENMEGRRWKPGIHLKKEGSRIWLQVTDIKVERLHHITTDDIIAEGIQYRVGKPDIDGMCYPVFNLLNENGAWHFMPKDKEKLSTSEFEKALFFAHFAELWCEINSRESWDENPWVWVVSFKVLSTTGKPDSIQNLERSVATDAQAE